MLSDKKTSPLMAEIIRWLNVELAPTISIHGVLVDVYGEGVLITGESGIGKSEAALELIKRGHRLVSDDVVEIRKVSDETLVCLLYTSAKAEFHGCVFQDSDLAKWIEASAFSLNWHPDEKLEKTIDDVIDLVCAAQQPDGYLDTDVYKRQDQAYLR